MMLMRLLDPQGSDRRRRNRLRRRTYQNKVSKSVVATRSYVPLVMMIVAIKFYRDPILSGILMVLTN